MPAIHAKTFVMRFLRDGGGATGTATVSALTGGPRP